MQGRHALTAEKEGMHMAGESVPRTTPYAGAVVNSVHHTRCEASRRSRQRDNLRPVDTIGNHPICSSLIPSTCAEGSGLPGDCSEFNTATAHMGQQSVAHWPTDFCRPSDDLPCPIAK